MSIEIIEKYYGLKLETSIQDGRKTRYLLNDSLYTIVDVSHVEQDTLIELYEISEHMAKHGDKKVSLFVAGREGKFLITHKERDYVLLKNAQRPPARGRNTGRKLAKFHERGKRLTIDISATSRIGKWKEFWIRRLEQMETIWAGRVREQPREEFEKLFLSSFPYYLGICENAIQYVIDTELDVEPLFSDRGTVCHDRFQESVWHGSLEIRDPFDWVYDHPGRDIAEWIRDCYTKSNRTFHPEMTTFLQGYQSIAPISDFTWRLIYARLLFPLHYFICVEEYFLVNSQWQQKQLEEKLRRILRDSRDYELFLGNFYHLVNANIRNLPKVDWLG